MTRRVLLALSIAAISAVIAPPGLAQTRSHGAGVNWTGGHGGVNWDGSTAMAAVAMAGIPPALRSRHTARRIYSSTSPIFRNARRLVLTTGSGLLKHFILELLTGTRRQLVRDIDPAGYRVRTGPSITQRTRSRC